MKLKLSAAVDLEGRLFKDKLLDLKPLWSDVFMTELKKSEEQMLLSTGRNAPTIY